MVELIARLLKHCASRENTVAARMAMEEAAEALSRLQPSGDGEPSYAKAIEDAARVAYIACAETRHVTLGDKAAAAIRALAGKDVS